MNPDYYSSSYIAPWWFGDTEVAPQIKEDKPKPKKRTRVAGRADDSGTVVKQTIEEVTTEKVTDVELHLSEAQARALVRVLTPTRKGVRPNDIYPHTDLHAVYVALKRAGYAS